MFGRLCSSLWLLLFSPLMHCLRDYSVTSVPNWRTQACRVFPSLLQEGSDVSVTCTFLKLSFFFFSPEKHFCGKPNCSLFYDDVTLKKRVFGIVQATSTKLYAMAT